MLVVYNSFMSGKFIDLMRAAAGMSELAGHTGGSASAALQTLNEVFFEMKMKLIIALAFFLIILIPGCNNASTTPQEQNVTTQNAITGDDVDPVTLTFYFPQLTGGEKADTNLVLSEIEDMTADLFNVSLDFNWLPPGTYADTVLEKLASGAELDAVFCGLPGQGLLDFTAMAREGLLADLTDALPQYAPGLLAQFERDDLNCGRVDGDLFVIPSLFPMSDNIYAIVRQDFVESYGLPPIRTFDDYGQYLAAIKLNEADIMPGKIADTSIALFARASGYAVFDKEHFLVYGWADDTMQLLPWEQTAEFMNVVGYLSEWARNDYLDLNMQGMGDIWNTIDLIISGDISSFLFAGEYRIGETIGIIEYSFNNYLESNQIPGEIKAYRLYPELQAQMLNPVGNGLTTGSIALSAASDKIDRTLMFMDWIQSRQEHYDLFMYGIEGRHYELQGEQLSFPDGVTIDQNDYMAWDGRQAFKNLAFERFVAVLPSDTRDDYSQNIRGNAVLAPHEGFYADDANISDLLEQRRQIILTDIELPLLTGTFDANNIDIVFEKLRNTGTDDIITDLQDQIASYPFP